MLYEPVLLCDGFVFPETPRWHRGFFYCCSIDEGKIFRIDKQGNKEILVEIDDWLSGWTFVGPDSNDIVLTSANRRKLLLHATDGLKEISDLSSHATWGINDMIRLRTGVIFVGSVNFAFGRTDPSEAPSSPLLRVDPTGSVSVASDETGFANGMVVTPDGKKLIVADSMKACLHQWDLEEDGSLTNHSIFASIPGSVPDGICLDEAGGIWVTSGRRGLFRVLEGGKVTDEVNMGDTGATACMLGGDDRRTLLITASDSHDRNIIKDNPSGRLFTVKVEIPGTGLPSFY